MPLVSPELDDLRFQGVADLLRRQIPQYAPEWTDHNDADPGMSILRALHVTPQHLRSMVPRNLNVLAAGPVDPTAPAPFTASASKALACATAIAREMDHAFVDTPHLLLAFLRLPECAAARVLAETPQVGHGFGEYLRRIYPQGLRTPDPEPLPARAARAHHRRQ